MDGVNFRLVHEVLNYITKNTTMRIWGVYKIVVEIPKEWGGGYLSGQKIEIPGRRGGGGL